MCSAAQSVAWIGMSPNCSTIVAFPKWWSQCSCVLTSPVSGPAPRRRTSSATIRASAADPCVSTISRPSDPPTSVMLTCIQS